MNPTHPSCPSCGTVLTIDHASTVSLVCKKCHAVLEKRGDSLRQVGAAAVAVPTRSSLQNGMDGAYQGTRFAITGHVQLSNEDGATWDEFYLGFSDGECGWLAQAQGRLMLSFRSPLPDNVEVPAFEELRLNQRLDLMTGLPALNVVEKGDARVEAASGQMPYLLQPGETYPYAECAAMSGAFASLDYSTEPPTLFVGREVTFDDLGMQPPRPERDRGDITSSPTSAPVVSGQMRCTECGTDMEIRNPGRTERATCVKCHAIFDVTSGRPQFLGTQEEAPFQPFAPLGAVGRLGGVELTLIGVLQRSTTDGEGSTWFWEEYLLSDEEGGYRWLAASEGHWTLFEPITGGAEIKPVVHYGGRAYKFFQHGEARVTHLEGEFYWNVAAGQTSYTADFIAPPYMLSAEFSSEDSTKGEANWTHGVYLPRAEVQRAFPDCEHLPRPRGVGPNQPFPHSAIFPIWGIATLVLIVIGVFLLTSIKSETVFKKTFKVELPERKPGVAPPKDEDDVQEIAEEIELKGGKNIRIRARSASLEKTWLELEGLLSPADRDELVVQPFAIVVWHEMGIDEGEIWTDDNREDSTYLSALPGGKYLLRINVNVDKTLRERLRKNAPANPAGMGGFGNFGNVGNPLLPGGAPKVSSFDIVIEQGHPRFWHLIVAVGLLAIVPLITWIWSRVFETKRWSNSNVNPSGAS